jgi:outer membrane protein assembly factor BamB
MLRALLIGCVVVTSACRWTASDGEVRGSDTTLPAPRPTTHDWTRFGWNAARTSAPTDSTGIDTANVRTMVRQQVQLDGTVDASPIYLHGVPVNGAPHNAFFVTTTYGRTEAIDANTGVVLWRFTPPTYDSYARSSRITTATPVADPDRSAIYAAAPDGYIRKLAVADGHVIWQRSVTLLPEREKLAAALNLSAGHVIATTGGYVGDAPPYQGHVAVLDAASGALLHVWNSLCSDRASLIDPNTCAENGSAIWGRAGAVIDSATGNIFVATGDGRWNGTTHWGDAIVELDPLATQILGNYTPTNTEELDASDADLGSSSPTLLGNGYVMQAGKDAHIKLLQWSAMRGASPHRGGEALSIGTPSGQRLYNAPAVLRDGSETWLFVADFGATQAFRVSGATLTSVWKSSDGGSSPVVAGGLLFVYDVGGDLRVYEARSGRHIVDLPAGSGHWNSPIVVDGMIALPEGSANSHRSDGILNIYRLP